MATAIEEVLYGDRGTHGVSEFSLSPGVIRLRLTPWEGSWYTDAVFHEVRITSAETYPDGHNTLDLPWDVLGFDCRNLGNDRWEFVLHCFSIEWCFESSWPSVSRTND